MNVAALQSLLAQPGMNSRVTRSTLVSVPTGTGDTIEVIQELPAELARQANTTLEAYSRARVLAGEGYGGDVSGKAAATIAIGQVLDVEKKRRKKSSITQLVTDCTWDVGDGRYGRQRGRYVATTSDPTRWQLAVAEALEAGGLPDLAQGAHHFLDPSNYVGGKQAGRDLGPIEVRLRAWILGERLTIRTVPTVDKFHLLFMGPTLVGSPAKAYEEGLRIYADGVAGRNKPDAGDPDAMTSTAAVAAVVTLAAAACWAALRWIG